MDFSDLFTPKMAKFSELTGVTEKSEVIKSLIDANWDVDEAVRTFHSRPRGEKLFNLITFKIACKSYTLLIEMFDHLTVGHLKQAIYKNIGLSPDRQQLVGWENEPHDSAVLKALNLKSPVWLQLLEPMEH